MVHVWTGAPQHRDGVPAFRLEAACGPSVCSGGQPMSARSHVVSAALSPLILAGLIACGVPEAEPVATIRGELSASSASSTQSAVMLAMGWYPTWFGYT